MCHELAELGMAMARATAQRAIAIAQTPEDPTADAPDYQALAFSRLSRAVNQAIALEHRISNPAPAPVTNPPGRLARHSLPPDPRRAPLKRVLEYALANHPDRAALKTETADYVEEALAADPDQTVKLSDILDATCEEYDLSLDFGHLPDDLLDEIAGPDPPPD